jgi:hypothetical protein
VRKETPKQERKLLCAYFVVVPVTWMSFASDVRGLRGGALIMPETHIVMSFLIFRLALSLALCLALLLVLCLSSFMDLTIAHMVLVHERTALSLDVLVTAHVLIEVIVSRVGLFFLLEDLTLTLSQDTWMVHVFPIIVHVSLSQGGAHIPKYKDAMQVPCKFQMQCKFVVHFRYKDAILCTFHATFSFPLATVASPSSYIIIVLSSPSRSPTSASSLALGFPSGR